MDYVILKTCILKHFRLYSTSSTHSLIEQIVIEYLLSIGTAVDLEHASVKTAHMVLVGRKTGKQKQI